MSYVRSLAHVAVTAGALTLAGAVAGAAFPMPGTAPTGANPPAPGVQEPGASRDQPFEAKKITDVAPVYPKGAKEDGAQGIFILTIAIDRDGRVSDARVIVSTPLTEFGQSLIERRGTPEALQGDDRLARAAVEAVRQWRYEPVLDEDGQPKAISAVVTVKFVLS